MAHEPYIRTVPGSRQAVVLIHGILGTPEHFRDLLPLIPAQWSVYNILLPGHGKSVRDFSRSSMDQWRSYVAELVTELSKQYDGIFIIAHSMGTLFAIREAVKRPQKIRGLFLLQTPLYPRMKISAGLRAALMPFGIVLKKAEDMYRGTSVAMDRRIWRYLGWIPRFWELFRECRATRSLLGRLSVPCRIYQCRKDEMVSPRTCRELAKYPQLQVTVLKEASHYAYRGADLALLQQELRDMIREIR